MNNILESDIEFFIRWGSHHEVAQYAIKTIEFEETGETVKIEAVRTVFFRGLTTDQWFWGCKWAEDKLKSVPTEEFIDSIDREVVKLRAQSGSFFPPHIVLDVLDRVITATASDLEELFKLTEETEKTFRQQKIDSLKQQIKQLESEVV